MELMKGLVGLGMIAFLGCSPSSIRQAKTAFVIGGGVSALALVYPLGCTLSTQPQSRDACGDAAPVAIAALIGVGISLVGGFAVTVVGDVMEHRSRALRRTVPKPGSVVPQESEDDQRARLAQQRKDKALELAATAKAWARDGHCDKAIDLATKVLALDALIHTNLMVSAELKACVPQNEPPLATPTP